MINWERAAFSESGSCIEVGTSDESPFIWLRDNNGRAGSAMTRKEFRDFVAQCQRGEWDHV